MDLTNFDYNIWTKFDGGGGGLTSPWAKKLQGQGMRIDSHAPVPSTQIVAPTHDPAGLGSILLNFYAQLFCICILSFYAKAACKMLLKLTLGLSNLYPIINKYNDVCSVEVIHTSEQVYFFDLMIILKRKGNRVFMLE